MLFFFVLVYVVALYIRPAEIIPALENVPVVDYLSIACAAVLFVTLVFRPRKFWNSPLDKYFLWYAIAITVSNPANGWFGGGQLAFESFLPVFFCYLLLRCGLQTVAQIRRIVFVIVLLNLFLAVNGLLQVYAQVGIGGVTAMETREGSRIQGTGIFNDPNDLGMTLVMTVPLVLSTVVGSRKGLLRRCVGLAALGALLLACYYTNSRGTMLGLGAVSSVYAYRRFGVVPATLLAAAGIVGILVLGPSRMAEVSAGEASAQGRIQAWAAGFQMFFSSPLYGVGWRQFAEVHERAAHNSFMHALGELGLFGAIPFVGMFYWYFVGLGWAQSSPDREAANRAKDLSDAGIGLTACMFFLSRQYTVNVFILLAIGASLALAAPASVKSQTPVPHFAIILALTFSLMVMLYALARLFAYY